ncbi:RICIN domain-containing protein [Sorangium sp. So ce216]
MIRKMTYVCLSLLLGACAASNPESSEETAQDAGAVIVSSVTEGDYIVRSLATGKCLDVSSASVANGADVQEWSCNGTNAQRFHVSPVGDGYFKIVNVNSGKALDVRDASTAESTRIQQWDYVGRANQQFKIVDRGNSHFSIQARHTNMALDVFWGGTAEGTPIVQYPYTGTSNQLYNFDKVDDLGCLNTQDGNTTLRFINRCAFNVNFAGNNIQGGLLSPSGEACRTIGTNTDHMISKRYWGVREGHDPGDEHRSLAEFGFNEHFSSYTSWDWFNLSHVDANNLPLKIVPHEVGGGSTCAAQTRSCPMDLLAGCPEVGKLRNPAGEVIACVSHDRDNPNSPVAKYFDAACSQSYSWSGDDSAMAACNAGDFDIIFCSAD